LTEVDVLVVGSGASGSSAALSARLHELDVLIVEKEPVFGGTTAFSGGWLWMPCNPLARREGIEDSEEDARTYLREEAGNLYDARRIEAFLRHGPEMLEVFERETEVRFFVAPHLPDYHGYKRGAKTGGRSICSMPFDGRNLGENLKVLRRPRRELLVFGMTLQSGADMAHFLAASRSPRSAAYVARRLLRSLVDRALYGRDVKLANGNALVARFLKSLSDRKVPIWLEAQAVGLLVDNGKVRGARVRRDGKLIDVRARRGVVLAAGGFPADIELRRRVFPHSPSPTQHYSMAPETNTGDGIRLGQEAGGVFDASLVNVAAWMPVSRTTFADGRQGTFWHVFDRGKPGVIAIRHDGRRFVNEGSAYPDFVAAMISAAAPGEDATAYLIGDHRAVRRYGFGAARPAPVPLRRHLRSGYIVKGDTIESLAAKIGIDGVALAATVSNFNREARHGRDPEFGRGSFAYNHYLGDLSHKPNPSLGPLEHAPFYAVHIMPGDIGTFAGLRTDEHARVVDADGAPIVGLYAVGADSVNVLAGAYPGGGSNLGPAITFGFIAGRHLAQ
jgi:succinate dehydrogenase/fumarate reductase flavoprotein subunit